MAMNTVAKKVQLAISVEARDVLVEALGIASNETDKADYMELASMLEQLTPEAGPYIVRWGYCNEESYTCPTFQDALAVARYLAEHARKTGMWVPPSIHADGRADGLYDGLSDEQREAVDDAVNMGLAARARTRALALHNTRVRCGHCGGTHRASESCICFDNGCQ